jgi:hypothetical protein
LRVVEPDHSHVTSAKAAHRAAPRRLPLVLAVVLVVGSLMTVVVGHSVLVAEQIRLTNVQAAITGAKNIQRQDVLSVSMLEAPTRIVADARSQLHMASPAEVVQLPYVALDTPLPTPDVTTPPAGTPASTAPVSSTSASGSSPAYAPATPASAGG